MKGWLRLCAVGMSVVLSGCVATSVLASGEAMEAPRVAGERAWLGLQMARGQGGEGVPVRRVFRSSPAEEAGIREGDVLRAVGGKPVKEPAEVSAALGERRPGDVVEVRLERKENALTVTVKLEAFPGVDEVLRRQRVGVEAPPLTGLVAVQGSAPLTLAELRGKVVVLDFWASWCVVCRKTVPVLNRWNEELQARGVVVLGVSNETAPLASRGIASFGIRYPVAIDREDEVFEAYGASSLPTLYVLDRRGVVRAVEVGFSREQLRRVEQLLAELLEEPG
jgi:peroxiredoxin